MDYKVTKEMRVRFNNGRAEARDEIRADVENALRRARASSENSHCYCVSFVSQLEELPASLCNLAMKIFCKNIVWGTMTMHSVVNETHELREAGMVSFSKKDSMILYQQTHVLNGSFNCIITILEDRSLSRKTVSILKRAWLSIVRCMVLVLDESDLSRILLRHHLELLTTAFCHLLKCVACLPKTRKLLLDDDIPKVMAYLWLIDHKSSLLAEPLKSEPLVTGTLMILLASFKLDEIDSTTFLHRFMQHASMDWDSFALKMYQLLNRFWDEERRDYGSVTIIAQAIVKMLPRSEFWTPSTKKMTLPLILRILNESPKVINRMGASTDVSSQIGIVKQCIYFCSYVFVFPSGVTWSVKLFRDGILQAIFNCIPAVARSPKAVQNALKNLVLQLIPSKLIFGSVIDAAANAWKETIANKEEPKFEEDFFRTEWNFLRNHIMERVIQKEISTLETGGKFSATCYRTGCNKREHEVRFSRCAACRMVLYCSKECQKIDWKLSHRQVCHFSYVPEDQHVIHRDEQCALRILTSETYRHRRGLKALAGRKFPGTPFNDLTVIVDYSNRKLVLDVQRSNNNLDGKDDGQGDGLGDRTFESIVGAAMARGERHPRSANAFGLMLVKMRQGSMSSHVFVSKELLVPDDDDFRPAMRATEQALRLQGEDVDGNPLETTWDEFDETLYRIENFGVGDSITDIPSCSFDHLLSTHSR